MSMSEIRKLWMPIHITKQRDGSTTYSAILSDTSIDRDEEIMSKELLFKWAKKKGLPALVNHENKAEKAIGGWDNLQVISKGSNVALTGEPWFYPKEVDPFADTIRKKIEYALDKGHQWGVSISAIPSSSSQKMIGGVNYKQWDEAELLEATWVPIQSNRNATYGHIAKSFDLEKYNENPKQLEGNMEKQTKVSKSYDKDGAHAHTESEPLGLHNHPEIESRISSSTEYIHERINNLSEKVNGDDLIRSNGEKDNISKVSTKKDTQKSMEGKMSEDIKNIKKAEPVPAELAPVEPAPAPTEDVEKKELSLENAKLKKLLEEKEALLEKKLDTSNLPTVETNTNKFAAEVELKHPTTKQMLKEFYGGK